MIVYTATAGGFADVIASPGRIALIAVVFSVAAYAVALVVTAIFFPRRETKRSRFGEIFVGIGIGAVIATILLSDVLGLYSFWPSQYILDNVAAFSIIAFAIVFIIVGGILGLMDHSAYRKRKPKALLETSKMNPPPSV
jgi:hypothetical protein